MILKADVNNMEVTIEAYDDFFMVDKEERVIVYKDDNPFLVRKGDLSNFRLGD